MTIGASHDSPWYVTVAWHSFWCLTNVAFNPRCRQKAIRENAVGHGNRRRDQIAVRRSNFTSSLRAVPSFVSATTVDTRDAWRDHGRLHNQVFITYRSMRSKPGKTSCCSKEGATPTKTCFSHPNSRSRALLLPHWCGEHINSKIDPNGCVLRNRYMVQSMDSA